MLQAQRGDAGIMDEGAGKLRAVDWTDHEARMRQLLDVMEELEGPDVHPTTKVAAATLLIQVPKCSVFWIEEASSADIREMIFSRIYNQPRPHQSREAVRLGEQVDKALLV